MSNIEIYGFAPSTYTQSALLAASATGVEVELVPLDFGAESHLALHPFARMPVLVDNDTKVFETLAIMAYLDTTYGKGKLFPAEYMASILEVCSAAIDYAYQDLVHADDDTAKESIRRALAWVDTCLRDKDHLAASTLTAADLLVAPMLEYYRQHSTAGSAFDEWPRIDAWLKTLRNERRFRTLISAAA